jgi:hypothetical protein
VNPDYRVSHCANSHNLDQFELWIPSKVCFNQVDALITISEVGDQSVLTLKEMRHRCPSSKSDKQKMLDAFQKQFIDQINQLQMNPEPASEVPNEAGAVARKSLYFVPIGQISLDLKGAAEYFRRRFKLTVKILPTVPIESWVVESPRYSPPVETLMVLMKAANRHLAKNEEVAMIGITEDMNVQSTKTLFDVNYRLDDRFAIISERALDPATFCEPSNRPLLEMRLRKAIAKNIAFLYYRMPKSDDPTSVSYSSVDCVDELDAMRDDFEFFPKEREN